KISQRRMVPQPVQARAAQPGAAIPVITVNMLLLQLPATPGDSLAQPVKLLLDGLRPGLAVVGTRAYTATRIRHLLGDQCRTRHAVLPGPPDQQLIGLIPPAPAVATRDGLAAHGPCPDHRALLPGRHHSAEQIPANAAAGATSSSSTAPAAHNRTCRL